MINADVHTRLNDGSLDALPEERDWRMNPPLDGKISSIC